MVSFCLCLFPSILLGLLLLQRPRTTPRDATTQTWALLPSSILKIYVLILGIWIQDLEFLSKARKLYRPAQVGRDQFLLHQFFKNKSPEHGMDLIDED